MNDRPANFDSLARSYRALEVLAFGRGLERARFCFADQIAACRSILILGEGDGRFLSRLLPLAPNARIHCIDSSKAMLAKAATRIAGTPGSSQVRFEAADVLHYHFEPHSYDAVVTFFFIDCFESSDARRVVERINLALTPAAKWLYADFSLPERGIARLRARLWLAVLYAFFRWQTGLSVKNLPSSEALIHAAGFAIKTELTLQFGLLRSVCFERR